MEKIVIIGAGLTGTLLAIFLGSRGHTVTIYDKNQDPDIQPSLGGKSINLTLCKRGMDVLEKVGLSAKVYNNAVPTYGRFIHQLGGNHDIQPYGNHNEALYAISRQKLNIILLAAARETDGVTIIFNKKCFGYDLQRNVVRFVDSHHYHEEIPFDILIGADGAHSMIRAQMQRECGFNFSQRYAEHMNKEMTISAEKSKEYSLLSNYIHIWPRNDAMLLGIPNCDGSFTCTLQLPTKLQFHKTEHLFMTYFKTLLPDAMCFMPDFFEQFVRSKNIPMITIRCSRWHISGKIVLIGDAAHAINPSYGQGANAGFEDCNVLNECLVRYPQDRMTAFTQFQKQRKSNTDAIAQLSIDHFKELRSALGDSHLLLRKRIERKLNLLFPSHYFSTYSCIAFTTMSYKKARSFQSMFNKIINELLVHNEIIENLDSVASEKLMRRMVEKMLC